MASQPKQFSIFYFFAISMYLLSGCATPAAQTGSSPESLRPGFDVVYYPQIQPGMTMEKARQDWVALFPGSVFQTGRIEMEISQRKLTLFNYQLLNRKIVLEARRKANGGYERGFDIQFPHWGLHFERLDRARRAADALFFFQQDLKAYAERLNQRLAQFEPVAARYRALENKPPVSEDQRRLIVQANALSQQKQYPQAIEQYLKALQLDPTAYPDAYFNLALLYGQMQAPVTAIVYMKHYLLLEPQAKDARGAQDKIYEWELMLGK